MATQFRSKGSTRFACLAPMGLLFWGRGAPKSRTPSSGGEELAAAQGAAEALGLWVAAAPACSELKTLAGRDQAATRAGAGLMPPVLLPLREFGAHVASRYC